MKFAAAGLVVGLAFLAAPQEKEKLRAALKDTEVKGDWIYDDLAGGFAEARKSGKPMMIVFR
jgi:hypothetical protein